MKSLQITASSYGIKKSKAEEIEKVFVPMVKMLKEMEARFTAIVSDQEINEKTIKKAKRLRLDIAAIRGRTETVRKKQKEFYLRGGKAIDGVANILKNAIAEKEDRLIEIEEHFEKIEQEKKDKLQKERAEILEEYEVENIEALSLHEMPEEVWQNFLTGTILNFKAKKEAEEKAEKERVQKEKEEQEERGRVEKENKKLKKEAADREKLELEEKAKKMLQEEKAKKALQEKKDLQVAREKSLLELEYGVKNIENINFGEMSDQDWKKFVMEAKENYEIKKENERKEREEKDKLRKELEKTEAKARAEKETRERLEKERREKEQEEIRIKVEAEQKQDQEEQEKEKTKKNQKFINFLKENKFDKETMEWRQNGNTFEIWERKASITI